MSKPHLQSRTLWVNFVAVIVATLLAFGVDLNITGEQQAAIVTIILGGINLVLRLDTDRKLSSRNRIDPMQGDLSETRKP